MKLATAADGSRDGHLLVVSSDHALAQAAHGRATRLQQVFDDWNFVSPQLDELAIPLNGGKARHALPWDDSLCLAPLPRAFRCVEARGQTLPGASANPEGGDDAGREQDHTSTALHLLERAPVWQGPRLRAPQPGDADRLATTWRLRPALALFTADLPAGSERWAARDAVRLIGMAVHFEPVDRVDQDLTPGPPANPTTGLNELAPAPDVAFWAFAPLVVTSDELGSAWRDGRATIRWMVHRGPRSPRGIRADRAGGATHRTVDAGAVLAAAARQQALGAGSVVLLPASDGDLRNADWTWAAGSALRVGAATEACDDLFGAVVSVGSIQAADPAGSQTSVAPTSPDAAAEPDERH